MKHWLATTQQLSLAFAQVREDALLDRKIIQGLGSDVSVLMIASGGCTAALLATCHNISRIHIADMNPAQIALCKLKLRLLQECSKDERMAILGHNEMDAQSRKEAICSHLDVLGYESDVFGPIEQTSQIGPDHMGRYEHLFAELRNELGEQLQLLSDTIVGDQPLDEELISVLRTAFDKIMDLSNLVALFGEEATQNAVKPFTQHFFDQTIAIFNHSHLQASTNPYLHQMLLGGFKGDACCYPWLDQEQPAALPDIRYSHSSMMEALQNTEETYDFIHLSNIVDWLNKKQAGGLLKLASSKLNKGGCVFIRQLNSNLNIPSLCYSLSWDKAFAEQLLNEDRSFFYPKLHVGIKA